MICHSLFFSVVLKHYFCRLYGCSIMGRSLCSSSLQGLILVCWHCGFTDGSLTLHCHCCSAWTAPRCNMYSVYVMDRLHTPDMCHLFWLSVAVSSKGRANHADCICVKQTYRPVIESLLNKNRDVQASWLQALRFLMFLPRRTRNCVYVHFISAYKGNHLGRLDDYKHLF